MIIDADKYVERFAQAGASWIGVHYEACTHLHRTIQKIKENGAKAYAVLNPHTPVEVLTDILVELDAVLLMTVNPGFSGQRFIEWTVEKIRRLRRMIKERSLDVKIMVDGGVNEETMQKVVCAGAEILVMGYGIFRNPDPASVRRMLEGIECSC
jgi:ribulose-5-phosphate 3-epimerase (EC 5.1.3.1)